MHLPRLYVCYGMPKSGSTLAYQLSRAIAERSGFDQSPLPEPQNSCDTQTKRDIVAEKLVAAEQSDRRMVVVKIHAGPTKASLKAACDGQILIQAHARDPRDIALSMRDAGLRGNEWGKTADGETILQPEDALDRLRHNVWRHKKWAELPGALCLNYEQTAFSSRVTATRIAAHMNVRAAPLRDALHSKRQFTQLNKGRSQRFLTEMEADQQERWYAEFKQHIDRYCPPPAGMIWPARLATSAARLLRMGR